MKKRFRTKWYRFKRIFYQAKYKLKKHPFKLLNDFFHTEYTDKLYKDNLYEYDKVELLFKKYPLIYPLMEDGFFRISTDIPKGWYNLFDDLSDCIQSYINNINIDNPHLEPVNQVVATQLKSKWAELCFYHYGGDKVIDGMIEFAQHISTKTCETCGQSGRKIKRVGWIFVECPKCTEELDLNSNYKGQLIL